MARTVRALRWCAVGLVLVAVIPIVGVVVAAVVGQNGTPGMWTHLGDVGEAFGALNSVLAGLALAVMIVTFSVQLHELRMQRSELAMQRESLNQSHTELHRTAEASLSKLHFELLRMSIDDAELAEVWPPLEPGLPHERNRQYLYANLIMQHIFLSLRIGDYTEARIQNELRYLFMSPLMRDYWRAATMARAWQAPATPEYHFAQVADGICREYEAVLASAGPNGAEAASKVRDSIGTGRLANDEATADRRGAGS
jgi:uncharacterized membrane protein